MLISLLNESGTYYLRLRTKDTAGNTSLWITLYTYTVVPPQQITKYYYFGGQRVAMRKPNGQINYLFGDQLGSTSLVTNASGQAVYTARYMPFGEVRSTSGST